MTNLNDQKALLDDQIRESQILQIQNDAKIRRLNQLVFEKDIQTNYLLKRIDDLEYERDSLLKSLSWKITAPVREMKRWVSEPASQAKKYVRAGIRVTKNGWAILPLPDVVRKSATLFLVKCIPDALLVGSQRACPTMYEYPPDIVLNKLMRVNYPELTDLPCDERPTVSIIIPIYGHLDFTLRCLSSIAYYLPTIPVEIIVVDDCSPDHSLSSLEKIHGLRLIRNETNQGFIRSCNAGAKVAKGDYVYFLNNDTEVTEGWLDELVRTFRDFPGTGLAGSKLIYPDGSLQEAGGIVWQDGSAWNFGRNQNASAPPYNYAREVDYCSGASIMILRTVFLELGGFDEHYLPAYCEDVDLALKIRARGYRVLYQPLSTVIHYEGVTSGTDLTQGVKAYQIQNTEKLKIRWQEQLSAHSKIGENVDAEKDRALQKRVLMIERWTPTPDKDAGSVLVFNIMLLLRDMGYQITFIAEEKLLYVPEYTADLQRIGVEAIYYPFCKSVEQHVMACGDRYDLVMLFRPNVVSSHLSFIQQYCPSAKTLFYTHDIHFLRLKREADLFNDATKQAIADEMKVVEYSAINSVDATIVLSTSEFDLLKPDFPNKKLHILPLIMSIPGTSKTFGERAGIVFIGGFSHTPNADAVKFFVGEVMPELRKKLPGLIFHIVGSNMTDDIFSLAASDVKVVGFVEDLTPFMDKMRIAVAPLRFGSGIKGKVGIAMAAGLPSVATSIAVEGMNLISGEHVLVADDPVNYAEEIARLYADEALWNRISQAGLLFAGHAWGMDAAKEKLQRVLDDIDLPKF